MLGPVLERLNDECLNPLIDRAFLDDGAQKHAAATA